MAKKMVENGIDQGTLYDLLLEVKTNVNLLLAKLDDDAGVTDTNYESTLAVDSSDAKIA